MVDSKKVTERLQMTIALSNLAQELRAEEREAEKPSWFAWSMRRGVALALAALVLVLSGSVVAVEYFSALAWDELALRAEYRGGGIVDVYVENQSKKALTFEKKVKLMQWSTGEEIPPISDTLEMGNTEFAAGSAGVMTIDISQMYDITELEKPLEAGDWYYFVLTNESFLFGNDWQCSVDFCESAEAETADTTAVEMPAAGEGVYSELQEYLDKWLQNPAGERDEIEEYYRTVSALLTAEEAEGKHIVSSVDPWLFVGRPEEGTVFDARVPDSLQYQLVGETHSILDAFRIPVGASMQDSCMVLSAPIPTGEADIATADGSAIPLIYIFQYQREELEKPDSYVFIRGQLYSAADLEGYRVYQDDSYVCCNVTELFYTDLSSYVEACTAHRDDLYMDEGVWARLRSIYEYYMNQENLEKAFYYENG